MTGTMRAAVLAAPGRLEIAERPVPRIEHPEAVLIDVKSSGICGTDLHILSVPPRQPANVGVILGHEFYGVVREIGDDVTGVGIGERVVVAPNVSCGQCVWCKRGLRNHCVEWTTHGIYRDGGLAPTAVVGAGSCFAIAPHVPDHIAVLAEPLSTVVNGVKLAAVFPGEVAVVLGAGPAGLMYSALLRLAGATVLAVEPSPDRAAMALRLGADEVIDPSAQDVAAAVMARTGGAGADVVVDAVGSQLGVALQVVRRAGRIVLFGLDGSARTDVTQELIARNELRIVGAFVGQDVFPSAIRLLEQGRIDLEPLVTHRIDLEDLPAAVEELRYGRAIKVEVEFRD
jgi:threonine dehydrogenase-like Zn-dependent dehydrogenase